MVTVVTSRPLTAAQYVFTSMVWGDYFVYGSAQGRVLFERFEFFF